jgi:hypothetical protein
MQPFSSSSTDYYIILQVIRPSSDAEGAASTAVRSLVTSLGRNAPIANHAPYKTKAPDKGNYLMKRSHLNRNAQPRHTDSVRA